MHRRQKFQRLAQQDNDFLEESITVEEDERTAMTKACTTEVRRKTINRAHNQSNAKLMASITQRAQNTMYGMCMAFKRAATRLLTNKKQATFGETNNNKVVEQANTVQLTYNSRADGHYVSKNDRKEACMPILRSSNKKVEVANGGTCKAKNVTQLPSPQLSKRAAKADTFTNFPMLLMSVGKTSNGGTISIFTKTDVTVHKETDVLIRCKGAPLLIGVRDKHGQYRISLIQKRGQWQPRTPSKRLDDNRLSKGVFWATC